MPSLKFLKTLLSNPKIAVSNKLNKRCSNDVEERPCDIVSDWCGWRSLRGWKRIRYRNPERSRQKIYAADPDDDFDNDQGKFHHKYKLRKIARDMRSFCFRNDHAQPLSVKCPGLFEQHVT